MSTPEPSGALIEAIADEVRHAVRGSTIGWPRESVDLFVEPIARAAYAAMFEHLRLTEASSGVSVGAVMTDPVLVARMKLGDLLMDPDSTEAQVNAAQTELLQAIRGERVLPTLIKNREQRLCTWVRDTDGEHCALPDAGVHWPHMTHEGVQFPAAARGFEGRELRVT